MAATRVDPTGDGTDVAVPHGGAVELALPENPGTGYRWVLGPLPDGIELLDDRVESTAAAPVPGAAAVRVFTVRVGHPGTVSARLRREWESGEAGSFRVTLTPR